MKIVREKKKALTGIVSIWQCLKAHLPHEVFAVFHWGKCSESHTCGEQGQNSGNHCNIRGLENSEEWEAQLTRQRLFINGVFCESAANRSAVQKVKSASDWSTVELQPSG